MGKLAILLLLSALAISSCTQNTRARAYGGSEEITLKKDEVLLNVTWKEADMWILTRDTITKTCYFRENSAYGILQGEIVIKNSKP